MCSDVLQTCDNFDFLLERQPEERRWDGVQHCSRHLYRLQAPPGVRKADQPLRLAGSEFKN